MSASEEHTAQEPAACMACRGTGVVLAPEDGEMRPRPCPWCDGDGVRKPEHDAQAHWRTQE
jgi:hypothetical protein